MSEKEKNAGESGLGVIDVPCCEERQDLLDMIKYVEGLKKFITKCPTPMSIAIQGDWGTGKTSTINMLQKKLEGGDHIKCVYFNTWQYSQFSMEDDLYLSFINALVHKCFSQTEKTKEVIRIVQKVGARLLYDTVKNNIGIDVEEFFKKQEERIEGIEKLKKEFAAMIKEEMKGDPNGRIVIFIDDLDRLNPEVAVELLEVIKLFMDVEKCIFVLAIDYDVVVSGVRSKYGQHISEEKCRSFFDKIIQLPFRLPVESYRLDKLIGETVKDDIKEKDMEALTTFVSEVLGANPRSYKRLANSFFLIKSVNEGLQKGNDQQLDNALIFGSLCIQMCVPKFYQLLVLMEDQEALKEIRKIETEEEIDTYIEKYKMDVELDEKDKKNMLRCLRSFNDFLTAVRKNNQEKENEIFTHLSEILQMTAITSVGVGDEQRKRAAPLKIDSMILNGQVYSVSTPTEATVEVYRQLLADDKLLEAYRAEEERMLTDDETRSDAFFRNKRELREVGDKKIYIGLSSSSSDKMKYTSKLCKFMEDHAQKAHVIWKYNDAVVFDSNNQ